jgi:hypothetical protein
MTYVIQGILLSDYLWSVNLSNYGVPHVPKSVTPQCAFTLLFQKALQFKVTIFFVIVNKLQWRLLVMSFHL